METEERKHSHFFEGLLIGGFLGGLAGLLEGGKARFFCIFQERRISAW